MTVVEMASLGAGVAQSSTGAVGSNRPGTIYLHDTLTPVTLYADETGTTTYSTNGTFITDVLGRIPGWALLGLEVDITIPPASTVTSFLQGSAGPPGPPGAIGPTGATGATGAIGPSGANYRGPFNAGTTYAAGEWVTGSDGYPYVSKQSSNTGHEPTTDDSSTWWVPWIPGPVRDAVAGWGGGRPDCPSEVLEPMKKVVTGGGTVGLSRGTQGGSGGVPVAPTAGQAITITIPATTDTAYYYGSGPLMLFDWSFRVTVTDTDFSTGSAILWAIKQAHAPEVLPADPHDQGILMRCVIGNPGTAWCKVFGAPWGDSDYMGTSGSGNPLLTCTYASTMYFRVRHTFDGWFIYQLDASGNVLNSAFATRQQFTPNLHLGFWQILYGSWWPYQFGVGFGGRASLIIDQEKLIRTPDDAGGEILNIDAGAYGGSRIRTPLRGATEFDDAWIAATIIGNWDFGMEQGAAAPAPAFKPGGTVYSDDYIWDHYWRECSMMRDAGLPKLARASINNFLSAAAGNNSLVPNRLNPTTGAVNDRGTSPEANRYCQGYITRQVYSLAYDGDLSWMPGGAAAGYTILKANLQWIEDHRQTGRGRNVGLFVGLNWFEVGADYDPCEAGGELVFESLALSSNVYLEYLAMVAIANQLGHAADAAAYLTKATNLKTAIQTYLWNSSSRWYQGYDTAGSHFNDHITLDVVFAAFAGIPTTAQMRIIRDRLMNPADFLRPYGLPQTAESDSAFTRGSSAWGTGWVFEPWVVMAAHALRRYGYFHDALRVASLSSKAARLHYATRATSGYPGEGWDPDDATPYGTGFTFKFFTGWGCGCRLWGEIAKGYDPYLIQATTTTVQQIGNYFTRP